MESERRRRRRIALSRPVSVKSGVGSSHAHQVHDFSMSGMSFFSEYPYPVGDMLHMTVNIAPKGKVNVMNIDAEVVHIETDGERFINGLKFHRKYQ